VNNEPDWHSFDFELKLYLGEFNLGRFVLPVQRRVFTLQEIRSAITQPYVPELPPSSAGYLLSSIPQPCTERSASRQDGWLNYCLKSYLRSYIDMAGDFASYQAKFSSKTRSSIKRKVKKFAQQAGGMDLRCYRSPSEIHTFFGLARPVSAASYQERLLDCGLPNDAGFMSRAVSAAKQDNIRAFLLFADGAPVSYLYCPVHDGVLEYAYLGYVPEYSRLSPGTVLQWLAMEQLFAEQRFTAFDFTEGDSEHKRFFSTHQVACSMQLVLKFTWKHRVLLSLHRFVESFSVSVTQTLDRLGLKQRIKKWIRSKA
jgi:CelD/BcsL family acetyltransferase involved in cellulose biosynthesis